MAEVAVPRALFQEILAAIAARRVNGGRNSGRGGGA
jgi:hypothetical protein